MKLILHVDNAMLYQRVNFQIEIPNIQCCAKNSNSDILPLCSRLIDASTSHFTCIHCISSRRLKGNRAPEQRPQRATAPSPPSTPWTIWWWRRPRMVPGAVTAASDRGGFLEAHDAGVAQSEGEREEGSLDQM